jgi:hypothetical protein
MDKLEQYLDQVCRSVGGPKAMRQHVRQELREHLLDAVAEHKAAGMSEDKALDQALADFGGPEEVRSELLATHGQRVMTVVIDKAIEWKEKTMKAKWLWTTWAHLALAIVIALEVLFITFAVIYIAPRFRMFIREGWIGTDIAGITWVPGYFRFLDWIANNTVWLVLGAAVLWGLFEWRVRGENKSLIRLSVFGTAAVVLMVMVTLTTAALVVPVGVGVPGLISRDPEQVVMERETRIDASVSALEEGLANKDWQAVQANAYQACREMGGLEGMGAAAPALTSMQEQPKVNEVRLQLKAARDSLYEALQASWAKDPAIVEAALRKFHEAYGKVRGAK